MNTQELKIKNKIIKSKKKAFNTSVSREEQPIHPQY